jgi:hypothetical protein
MFPTPQVRKDRIIMAKENKFLEDLKAQNLVDERELVTVADINCTNGNNWRGWVCIHGTTMRLFSMTFPACKLDELIDEIELPEARLIKTFGIVPFTLIKFQYQSHTYRIEHFSKTKEFIQTMKETCGK